MFKDLLKDNIKVIRKTLILRNIKKNMKTTNYTNTNYGFELKTDTKNRNLDLYY